MKKFLSKPRLALLAAIAVTISLFAGIFATTNKPTFSDVPANHWAYSYVERAADEGWVNGIGGGKFGVDNQVTYGEMFAMLVRVYLSDEPNLSLDLPNYTEHWYDPYCMVADDYSFTKGLRFGNSSLYRTHAEEIVNRYDMTLFFYNVMTYYAKSAELYRNGQGTLKEWGNFYLPKYDAASVQAGIADWNSIPNNYREAVTAVAGAGIITGVDGKGTFNGNGVMTRSQAATVMCRFIDIMTKNGAPSVSSDSTNPTDPPKPSGELGQKLPSGATAAAGVKEQIGKNDAYPTYGNSDVVSNNGYFTGAPNTDIGNAQLVYDFLDWVNEARVAEGHEPLEWVSSDAAEEHTLQRCYELVSNFSHERPKGKFAGEVIAKGQFSAEKAFNDWMNSPGHKQTLMSDTDQYMSAAKAGNYWIICVWSDFGLVEKCASADYSWDALYNK